MAVAITSLGVVAVLVACGVASARTRDAAPAVLSPSALTGAATAPAPLSTDISPITAADAAMAPGTLISASPLTASLWVPNNTAKAFRISYVTTNEQGLPALATGEIFVPRGTAPKGGWPVMAWDHGTSGNAEACAPSLMGPAEPYRDLPYLSNWESHGYAIVATDYVGLGESGPIGAYLNGISEAHNTVDIVKAGEQYARTYLGDSDQFSDRWFLVGQSQGGGAAIYTARYATDFGGAGLDYVGAVGTGVPALEENLIDEAGPETPASVISPDLTPYITYILDSLVTYQPQLNIPSILTATGKKFLALGNTECVFQLVADEKGVNINQFFTVPVSTLPNFASTLSTYMAMPETGFDKPFFIGSGVADTDVPYALTSSYASTLEANGQPVTFHSYPGDHSATLIASQAQTVPFIQNLLSRAGTGPVVATNLKTSLRLAHRTTIAWAIHHGIALQITAPAQTQITATATPSTSQKVIASAVGETSSTAVTKLTLWLPHRLLLSARKAKVLRIRVSGAGISKTITLH